MLACDFFQLGHPVFDTICAATCFCCSQLAGSPRPSQKLSLFEQVLFFNLKGCQVISLSHFTQKQLFRPLLVDVHLRVALDPLLFSHCSGWFHILAACQRSDEPLQSLLLFFFVTILN